MLSLILTTACLAQGTTTSLSDYLKDHAPAGKWIAVDPEKLKGNPATALASFDRKEARVGGLTAIVPTTMVTIDDPTGQTPNLADGLSREGKILALLASLTPEQWRQAGGKGLGLNDLRGDSRALLASLLPRPLSWDRYHLHGGVMAMRETEHLTLPEKDSDEVRLRLHREVQLFVHPEGGRGSFAVSVPPSGPSDTTLGQLDTRADANGAYGIAIRKVVPNRVKPGGIRFEDSAYDTPVTLPPATTVREALSLVTKAIGRSVLADVRVADLPVASSGGTLRAGDLLGALSLAVTGTYRPVGPGYVLTSDLIGLGVRKARVDRWLLDAAMGSRDRSAQWRAAIAGSGGLRSVGYPADASLRPDDGLQERIDSQTAFGTPPDIPVGALPPEFGAQLTKIHDQFARGPRGLDFDPSRVGLRSDVVFGFVLPDGTEVEGGRLPISPSLDPPRRGFPNRSTPPVAGSPERLPEGSAAPSVLFVAENPSDLQKAVEQANAFGFRELWLETHEASLLKEAIAKAGRPVRLVIRPWTVPAGTKAADPDRTLLGDRAGSVADLREGPTPGGRDLMPPSVGDRLRDLAGLAQTPGLAGCAVLDTQPEGYAPTGRPDSMESGTAFGYSDGFRWAFLQKEGIDPVDIVGGSFGSVELQQPFFPDRALASLAAMNREGPRREPEAQIKAPERWRTFRIEANERATDALLDSLGSVPTLIGARSANAQGGAWGAATLFEWHAGEPLPILARRDLGDTSFRTLALRSEPSGADLRLRQSLSHPENSPLNQTVFDLADVPPARWTAVLNRVLKPRL